MWWYARSYAGGPRRTEVCDGTLQVGKIVTSGKQLVGEVTPGATLFSETVLWTQRMADSTACFQEARSLSVARDSMSSSDLTMLKSPFIGKSLSTGAS